MARNTTNLWKILTAQIFSDYYPGIRKCFYSAWIKSTETLAEIQKPVGCSVDVERLFTRDDIQHLLKRLTGIDLEGKLFRDRKISQPQRPHYALMTNEAYKKTVKNMRDIGMHFLQFVPVLEPRHSTPIILSKDSEIENFDDSKFVFTDLSFGYGIQVHSVVVRETDGTLRSATPEERDRMTRVYKGHPHRPVYEPAVFKDPYLQLALDRDDHEYVLDWACHYYLPNDPSFIELCHTIFDRTVEANKFDVLHSTRHFGPFTFYIVLNKKFPSMLRYFIAEEKIRDAANLIRLIKAVFPDEAWSSRMKDADDDKVLQEYAKENRDYETILQGLLNTNRRQNEEKADGMGNATINSAELERKIASTMNKESYMSEEGPLGEMAKDYDVRVVLGSSDAFEKAQKISGKSKKRKNREDGKKSKK